MCNNNNLKKEVMNLDEIGEDIRKIGVRGKGWSEVDAVLMYKFLKTLH